jgi:hypothetical protein
MVDGGESGGWVEMKVEMEVMVEVEVMGGSWVGPMCLLYFYHIHMHIYAMQKYFYDTIKYKKMNDGSFSTFLCLHDNYFLRVLLRKNYLYGAWIFYNAMMRIFISFLMQVLKSKHAKEKYNAKNNYG